MPDRPPRLQRIFQSYYAPLWFVTCNTYERRRLLANKAVHDTFLTFAHEAEHREVAVGRFG